MDGSLSDSQAASSKYVFNDFNEAMLSADIETNAYGGFGLQHTSTTGPESRIMLHHVKAEWQ